MIIILLEGKWKKLLHFPGEVWQIISLFSIERLISLNRWSHKRQDNCSLFHLLEYTCPVKFPFNNLNMLDLCPHIHPLPLSLVNPVMQGILVLYVKTSLSKTGNIRFWLKSFSQLNIQDSKITMRTWYLGLHCMRQWLIQQYRKVNI